MPTLKEISKEYETILVQLSDPELISNSEKFEELTRKRGRLEKIIGKEKDIQEIKNRVEENKLIISAGEDSELVSLAEAEIIQLQEKEKILEKELENLVNYISRAGLSDPRPATKGDTPLESSFFGKPNRPKGWGFPEKLNEGEGEAEARQNFDSPAQISSKFVAGKQNLGEQAVIVEIRAGTGGKEAALFSADLLRMYSKYAQSQGWQQRTLDSRASEIGGLKEVIFELKGNGAFSKMKYEGGVHRVQRIPQTEKSGRIHTSTASVAVLPKPRKTEIKISPADLKVDFYRASGPGGQYVNKRETAVRITHLPTGIVVTSQTERNQLQNKENALAILEARILERKEIQELEKLGEERKAQIKWAKRAEKIRTYNFPQDRVTDHRIKKSWKKIERIMAGELEQIVECLKESDF